MVNVRRYAVVGLFVAIGLGGCSTVKQGEIGEGVVKAATTPLSDLNLVKVEIPGVLLRAKEGVYLMPKGDMDAVGWDVSRSCGVRAPEGYDLQADQGVCAGSVRKRVIPSVCPEGGLPLLGRGILPSSSGHKEGVRSLSWSCQGVADGRDEGGTTPNGGLGGVGCAAVRGEIEELDAVLGADVDVLGVQTRRSIGERVGDEVQGSVMGTLQGVAEGVVPFRGWVRKLSGAQRYSKKVDAAIKAGELRRAFLKGVLVGGCR